MCADSFARCLQFDTVRSFQAKGLPPKHPLLDRVAHCSANPDAAVDFFSQLFWPEPEERLLHEAQAHVYLSEVYLNLEALGPNQDSSEEEDMHTSGTLPFVLTTSSCAHLSLALIWLQPLVCLAFCTARYVVYTGAA